MVGRSLVGLALASVLAIPAAAGAQDAKSGDLAKQLILLLDTKQIKSVAAADTENPGTFVAALYVPGAQLLVVSAKYTQPSLLTDLLARKDFQGVYVELSSASVQSSKLLVMDAYANGLFPKPSGDQPSDSVDRAGKVSTFDGAWKKAKIPQAEYMKSFSDADADYTRLLHLLIGQLKPSGT